MSATAAQLPALDAQHPPSASDVGRRYLAAAVQTGIGGIVSRVLQGLTPIILARYLGPREYGVYALVLSLVGIMAGLSPLGQDTALEKFLPEYARKDPARGGAILANTVILFSAALAILCAAFFFAAHWISTAIYHDASLTRVFQFSAALVLTLSLYNLATSVAAGLQNFQAYSRAMMVRGAVFLGLGWLGVWLLGFYGALLGQLLAAVAALGLLAVATVRASRQRFPGFVRPQFSKSVMREIFGLALPAFLTGLLIAPAYWWASTLLARHAGFADVGIFTVAFSLTQLILVVPSNLSLPAVSFLSEAHSSGQAGRFGSLVGDNFRVMWVITLPLAAGCAVLATPLIRLLFGAPYERAGSLMAAMSMAGLLMILNSVVVNACYARGYLWQPFFFHLGWLVLFLGLAYLLVPAWGAGGLAGAFVLSYAPLAVGAAVYAAKILDVRFTKVVPLLALTAAAFLATLALHRVARGPVLLALGSVMTLVLVAAEWIWVFDAAERAEVKTRVWRAIRPSGMGVEDRAAGRRWVTTPALPRRPS